MNNSDYWKWMIKIIEDDWSDLSTRFIEDESLKLSMKFIEDEWWRLLKMND
jgi:hypothetical protein